MTSPDAGVVAARVGTIRARIAEIGGGAVSLVAVTKGQPVDSWSVAAEAGCDAVGENYARELLDKFDSFPGGEAQLPVHFIGSLQSNKVRQLAPAVDLWQGVDRVSVLNEIGRRPGRSPGGDPSPVLIQVNTTGEGSKSGCEPGEVEGLLSSAASSGVSVVGLMTIGPTHGDRDDRLRSFRLLRRIVDDHGLAVCSMGMSHDFEEAVECGSTMVRIGTALFGPRA